MIGYGYDSNIFYAGGAPTGDEIISSRETIVQPKFEFDLPRGDNWVRWAYTPVYRNYATDAFVQSDHWSQFFDLDGRQRFGTRGFAVYKDHFVLGTQELREVDPGGELTFGLVPFRHHEPSVEIGMDVGARQAVSLVWTYDSTQFQDTGTAAYNYRGHGLEGRFTHKVGVSTDTYVYYSGIKTDQDRGGAPIEDVQIDTRTIGIGVVETLNRSVVTQFTAGYQEMDFVGAAPSNYAGLVFSANAAWVVGEITRISFTVRRQPYQSFYLNNNFYLNRSFVLNVTRQFGGSAYWSAGVGLENNSYSDPLEKDSSQALLCDPADPNNCPSDGVRRRDRGWRAEAGFGFRTGRSTRLFLGYNHQVRASNILNFYPGGFADPFDYTVDRLGLRIEVGWL